ncbi:hypothetical protein [Porphyromonas gingivalis]|nr:hypothetical protein [Porphyromonas gingivalis]
MPVKVQDGNDKNGSCIGVELQGFKAFLPTMHVAGSTPALVTIAA